MKLSIIVASYNAAATIAECLGSLERQHTSVDHEVIVVDSSTDGTAALVARDFPWVKLLPQATRTYCGEARNLGIAAAGGEIIAFLDADCTVDADWIERVSAAHASHHLAVSGVVENSDPASAIGWAYLFCEFNLWLARSERREIREAAGCCLSLKREAYQRYGPFVEGCYGSDSALQWRLNRDGHRVLHDPRIRVYHRATHGAGEFLCHLFRHRRDFACVNVWAHRMSLPRRLLLAGFCLAQPPALLLVIARRVLASSVPLGRFIGVAPLVLAGMVARSWGELTGYLVPTEVHFPG